jgi:hypothetical protein
MMDDASVAASGTPTGKTPPGGSVGSNGSGASGQQIVREIGIGPANCPLLTKTNYTKWALIMKIKLRARNLWEAIQPGGVPLQEAMFLR